MILSTATGDKKGHYRGWIMVFVGAICMGITFGLPVSILPVLYPRVIAEFGWTHTEATLAYTYKNFISAGVALFIVAPFVDKLGLRLMMMAAIVLTGGGLATFMLVDSLTTYHLAVLALGAGQAFTMLGVKLLLSRWFTRRQGLAVGIALAGSSLGGTIFPLAFDALSDAYGWRAAMGLLSLSIWVFVLPIYLIFAEENPSTEEIAPEATKSGTVEDGARILREADDGITLREVIRQPMFWCACLGIAMIQAVDSGIFQHTALIVESFGLSATLAAAAVSATFAFSIGSKVAAGWFFDWLSIRGIQIWWVLIGFSVLLAFGIQGIITLIIFAAVRGLAHGGLVAESPVLTKHCFGPRLLNQLLPIFTAALTAGGATGPLIMGACYDHFGDYTVGLIILACMAAVATMLLFFVHPHYRNRFINASRASAIQPTI